MTTSSHSDVADEQIIDANWTNHFANKFCSVNKKCTKRIVDPKRCAMKLSVLARMWVSCVQVLLTFDGVSLFCGFSGWPSFKCHNEIHNQIHNLIATNMERIDNGNRGKYFICCFLYQIICRRYWQLIIFSDTSVGFIKNHRRFSVRSVWMPQTFCANPNSDPIRNYWNEAAAQKTAAYSFKASTRSSHFSRNGKHSPWKWVNYL